MVFGERAKQRLVSIHGEAGETRFAKVNDFVRIAEKYAPEALLVPATLDEDLHEILCARDHEGKGLEEKAVFHFKWDARESTVGKTMAQLRQEEEVARRTAEIFEREGVEIPVAPYRAPACTFRVIAA